MKEEVKQLYRKNLIKCLLDCSHYANNCAFFIMDEKDKLAKDELEDIAESLIKAKHLFYKIP